MPAGSYSQIGYDAQGNITGLNAMSGHSLANTFNERGELTSSIWSAYGAVDSAFPNVRQHNFNGVMLHESYSCTKTAPITCSWNDNGEIPDALGAAIYSVDNTTGGDDVYTTYQWDNGGRATSTTQGFPARHAFTGTSTKSYDAEDRLTTDAYTSWGSSPTDACASRWSHDPRQLPNFTLRYDWGSDGHPVRFSDTGRGTTETLHWEGDTLAFTTNSAGQLDDLKFGGLADYTPLDATYRGITFWDRDPFGAIASSHNATGYGTWTASSAAHDGCTISGVPADSAGYTGPSAFGWLSGQPYRYQSNGLLLQFTPDGFTDGFNNTNGIRTLSNASSSWTVPDPYRGLAFAPQTQKAYVYAGNNPASNADPSGYLSGAQQDAITHYFASYAFDAVENNWACTQFIMQVFQEALHWNLAAQMQEDYNALRAKGDYPNLASHGYIYGWQGMNSGHPELSVENLHNFFGRAHSLHAWQGNSGMQVGDILFCGKDHMGVWKTYNHVAMVSKVDRNGKILMIAEGTGDGQIEKPFEDFVKSLGAEGEKILDFARLVEFSWKAAYGQSFMSGDDPYGWLNPPQHV
jgi:hypothetical protein